MNLQDAASKVREVIEENAMLSKRLDKAIRRESQLEADILERQKRLIRFRNHSKKLSLIMLGNESRFCIFTLLLKLKLETFS
jgi:hypothetical protein